MDPKHVQRETYVAIGRGGVAIAGWLDLVKVVLVELANKARHVAVLEMLGQDGSRKLFALVGEYESITRIRRTGGARNKALSHLDDDERVAILSPSSDILM